MRVGNLYATIWRPPSGGLQVIGTAIGGPWTFGAYWRPGSRVSDMDQRKEEGHFRRVGLGPVGLWSAHLTRRQR